MVAGPESTGGLAALPISAFTRGVPRSLEEAWRQELVRRIHAEPRIPGECSWPECTKRAGKSGWCPRHLSAAFHWRIVHQGSGGGTDAGGQ